jgi:hypothetical protein
VRGYGDPRQRCGFCNQSIASRQMTNHKGSDRCLAQAKTWVRSRLDQHGEHPELRAAIGKLIGLHSSEWPGRCYEIAGLLMRHELIADEDAKLRYGHWLGPVSRDCVVESWRGGSRTIIRHGWIEIPPDGLCLPCKTCGHLEEEHEDTFLAPCTRCDCPCYEADTSGTIIDPTRWVFEARRPYIYVGRADHYDMGGNRLRAAMRQPCPDYSSDAERSKLAVWKHDPTAHRFVMQDMFGGAPGVTERMAAWLGNAPLDDLGHFAAPIYRALIEAGHGAHIPIDNRNAVLGDEER